MAFLGPVSGRDAGATVRLALLAVLTFAGFALPAESAAPKEYRVKAVFLLNFGQFVEWPAGTFPEPGTPFVIGVLGDDPFGTALDQAVAGEAIHGHPIAVRRFRDAQAASACHILFISGSESARLPRILASLGNLPILTVGDMKAFAENHGAVQFVLLDNRIRLRINLAAARAAALSISSQLLRQAELVESGKRE